LLTTLEEVDILANVSKQKCSEYLTETLRCKPLASNTEKARSEMIIAPILIEVKKQLQSCLSLFSGVEFEVDAEKGLSGYCDFILSQSNWRQWMLVEGKNKTLKVDLDNVLQKWWHINEREGNKISSIYGAVTTGTNWKFLKLSGHVVEIDLNEYYLTDIEKILKFLTDLPNMAT
jgi:hypothetical protein